MRIAKPLCFGCVLVICLMPIDKLAVGAGRGSGGPPAGVNFPTLPSTARGPTVIPDPASRDTRGGPPAAAQRGISTAAGARRQHARELWRANREVLDFDPQSQLIVRGEIVALASTQQALTTAQDSGFVIRRQQTLAGFATAVVVLDGPRGKSLRRALQELRAADPAGAYDYNHIYFETATATRRDAESGAEQQGKALPAPAAARVGLIDGGVAASHPALRSVTVRSHGCKGVSLPSEHGTAVASLLAGGGSKPPGTASKTELFAADVYCGAPTGGATDALLDALAWLVQEHVPVINISLVGPPNALLQRAIDLAVQRGHLIVAAVGNDGPAAAPLYPASYPLVVAVTAVDQSETVLLEAGRHTHVDFAAPGAGLSAASLPDKLVPVRGTSFAAPIVARLLAERLDRTDRKQAEQALKALIATAVDLGAHGYDPVYGNGLVGGDWQSPTAPTAQNR